MNYPAKVPHISKKKAMEKYPQLFRKYKTDCKPLPKKDQKVMMDLVKSTTSVRRIIYPTIQAYIDSNNTVCMKVNFTI